MGLLQHQQHGELASACRHGACMALSLGMTVLQLGQFVPQHVELYRKKSVVGLSARTLFFGSTYTFLAMIDLLLGDNSQSILACGDGGGDDQTGVYACFVHLQPAVQTIGSWLLLSGLWVWYIRYERLDHERRKQTERAGVLFEPTSASATPADESEGGPSEQLRGESPPPPPPRYYDDTHQAYFFFRLYTLIAVLGSVAAVLLKQFAMEAHPRVVDAFADACGYVGTFLCGIMWVPQIVMSYSYGHRGSLSVLWVFATFAMDVIYSVYMYFMAVPFSVWANNIPDGVCTLVLLAIVGREERRDARAAASSSHEATAADVGGYAAIP